MRCISKLKGRLIMIKRGVSLLLLPMVLFTQALFSENGDAVEVGPPQQSIWQTIVIFGVMVLFFYVILLRPEQRRRKALEKQRSTLKKGDRVTAMGIIGIVDKIQQDTIILKMIDGTRIEFLTGAITDVSSVPEEESKE